MKKMLIVLLLTAISVTPVAAIQDCSFGYCDPTPSGGCALPSYYWACINNTALCFDSASGRFGYDCWAVDSCQEAFCYIQPASQSQDRSTAPVSVCHPAIAEE